MENYLGFNPRDLGVFQPVQSSNEDSMTYKPAPDKSVSEDGVYRSQIRILYNVFDMRNSIVEKQQYALRDQDGFFLVDSALSLGDRNCPLFKGWKKLRYSNNETLMALGNEVFEKRFTRWCLIQVVDDPNRPELNGKFMYFKLPKFIWELMQAKMNPAPETNKVPVPVMDFMRGTVIELEVKPGPDDPAHPERKKREISYSTSQITSDIVPVTREDGSSFLDDADQTVMDRYIEMESAALKKRKAADRDAALSALAADPITDEVSKLYGKVAEQLKKVCPNISADLGFHYFDKEKGLYWDQATTDRVNRFCETTAKGINPAKQPVMITEAIPQPVPTTAVQQPSQSAQPTQSPTFGAPTVTELINGSADKEDDLPF